MSEIDTSEIDTTDVLPGRPGGRAPDVVGLDPGIRAAAQDPASQAAVELARRDPVLARLVDRHGLPTISHRVATVTPFEGLVRSIVFQQLAGRAAAAIHGRLVTLLGGAVSAEGILAQGIDGLRTAGLSGSKAASLSDLAARVDGGSLPLGGIHLLEDEQVVSQLTEVRGIGRWTAEMFLIFNLGRLDVWPVGDYGVRSGYAFAWGLDELPTARQLAPLGEPLSPFRSVAAWYCWRAVEDKVAARLAGVGTRPST